MDRSFKLNFLSLLLIIFLLLMVIFISNLSAIEISYFFFGLKGEQVPTILVNDELENIWCKSTLAKINTISAVGKLEAQYTDSYLNQLLTLRYSAASLSDEKFIDYDTLGLPTPKTDGTFFLSLEVFSEHENLKYVNDNRKRLCSLWYSLNN